MIYFKFPELRAEFEGERTINEYKIRPKLRVMVFALAGYVIYHFNKSLVVTEILRDQKIQDQYYRDNPEYRKKPWKSVHQFGRGVDIRAGNFTDDEINKVLAFLNSAFDYGDGEHKAALCHDIGFGKHFHLQVSGNY